jgi:hypothetical protein
MTDIKINAQPTFSALSGHPLSVIVISNNNTHRSKVILWDQQQLISQITPDEIQICLEQVKIIAFLPEGQEDHDRLFTQLMDAKKRFATYFLIKIDGRDLSWEYNSFVDNK